MFRSLNTPHVPPSAPAEGTASISSAPSALRAAGVRKSYRRREALCGLDLEASPGETLGLLGPNGAGKTTTMQLIAGLLRPDAGTLRVFGDDATKTSTRRRVGLAPQALALYSELTAEENLRFFGRLYGLRGSRLAERVEACLGLAALLDRRKERVVTFSGGMQRRLNLACAVVHEPELLLLDEPTVGVDPQSRNHIFDCLERLKGLGLTILYSTHYMEEAERLCDRVAIIDAGRILAAGTVPRLVEAHGDVEPVIQLVEPPQLESVFLTLTGRSLRDGGAL